MEKNGFLFPFVFPSNDPENIAVSTDVLFVVRHSDLIEDILQQTGGALRLQSSGHIRNNIQWEIILDYLLHGRRLPFAIGYEQNRSQDQVIGKSGCLSSQN